MLAYWMHSLDPFVIKFPISWPIKGVRWYGVAYLFSFVCAYKLLNQWYKCGKIKLNITDQQSFLFAVFCGILIGGRLGYIFFYRFDYYKTHPLEILMLWEGGMASHGGFLGVFFALLIWGYRYKFSVFSLADLIIPLGTFGIFFGRCANFINGEVYGTVTQMPWAVIFQNDPFPRHPSQLYEAIGEGLLLFLWSLCRIFKDDRIRTHPGLLASHFLIYYGIIRCFLEYFREPDAPLIGFFSRGKVYSFFTILVGIIFTKFLKNSPFLLKNCVFGPH